MQRKTYKGFTFLEVLLVSGLIVIMTGIVLVSTWDSRREKELAVAMRTVAAVLREAQNNALSGKQLDATKVPCSFNILYGDPDGDPQDNPARYTMSYNYHGVDDEDCNQEDVIATYTLENGVVMGGFDSIVFDLPHGIVNPARSTSIVLTRKDKVAHVCVYFSGLVEEGGEDGCPL
ncbi:MAG TPA: hypothetical protein VJH89_00930 [Patescibacteria group bacterium]|nr:hypothetical protein [Patescibacteria group bacterium]